MGIVQRQGLQNSIFTYLGVGLGMVNALILYPEFLSKDELGLVKILPLIAVLYAQFSSLGFSSVVLRFFPFFKDKKRKNHGFLPAVLIVTLLAFLIFTAFFIMGRPWVTAYFEEDSKLFTDYFYLVVPLGLFWMWNALLEAFLGALYKTVIPTFMRGLLIHLLNGIAILIFAFGWVEFEVFLFVFVGLNFIPTLVMVVYLIYLKQFHFRPRLSFRLRKLSLKMLVQGGYVMFNGIASYFYQIVDSVMLLAFLGGKGLGTVAVYATMIPIVRVMVVPATSMYKVVFPLVGEHWKNNALDKIEALYKKVSLVNLVMGSFIFMCILINMHVLFQDPFPLTDPEWKMGQWVILIIGFARIFDLITGINSTIIVTSKYYRYNTAFMLGIFVLAPLTNWLLIPPYGIIGAAIATTLTSMAINSAQIAFVWIKFKIQPFSRKTLVVLLVTAIVTLGGFYLPRIDFFILDVLYRTIICAIIFGWIILKLRVSPDIRDYVVKLMKQVGLGGFLRYIP